MTCDVIMYAEIFLCRLYFVTWQTGASRPWCNTSGPPCLSPLAELVHCWANSMLLITYQSTMPCLSWFIKSSTQFLFTQSMGNFMN